MNVGGHAYGVCIWETLNKTRGPKSPKNRSHSTLGISKAAQARMLSCVRLRCVFPYG